MIVFGNISSDQKDISLSLCAQLYLFLFQIAAIEVVSKCQKCPSQSSEYCMGFSSAKAGPATVLVMLTHVTPKQRLLKPAVLETSEA